MRAVLFVVPAIVFYFCWGHFGLAGALSSVRMGMPVNRSLQTEPRETQLVSYLRKHVELLPNGTYRGVVASILGNELGPIRAVLETPARTFPPPYLDLMQYLQREHGNTYMFQDLWTFGIPTLEEYGHFVSPANYRVAADLLAPSSHVQLPTILFTYRANSKMLQAFGVRYLVSDIKLNEPGLRYVLTQDASERTLTLPELKQKLAAHIADSAREASSQRPTSTIIESQSDAVSAAALGDVPQIRKLHQSGIDLRIQNDAPLIAAASAGHINVIRYFHENGVVDPSTKARELVDAASGDAKYAVIEYLVNSAGVPLASFPIARSRGLPLFLYELEAPNLANYSPTMVTHATSAADAINRMRMDDFTPTREVIVQEQLPGPHVAIRNSRMHFERNSIRLTAESPGRSLLLLPVQFSRCWTVQKPDGAPGTNLRLVRANLAQTVVEFDAHLDVRLRFSMGYGHDANCRKRDAAELRAIRIIEPPSTAYVPR